MKKIILLLVIFVKLFSVEMTADSIIEKVDAAARIPSAYMIVNEVIVNVTGTKSTFKIESWSKNGTEKQLQRYLEPSKVKGTAFLMLNDGDDIWAYFSSTGRTRLIASHMRNKKMMGSDFTYEDMSMISLKKNYKAILLGSEKIYGRQCYKLSLSPLIDSSYKILYAYVDKEHFLPLQIDYLRPDDSKPFKRLIQGDIKVIDGHPTAFKIMMKNLDKGTITAMEIEKVDYNKKIEDSIFSSAALKR